MVELTINQLIKIVLGILVIAVVAYALYSFFSDYIIDFFKGFGMGEFILGIIK